MKMTIGLLKFTKCAGLFDYMINDIRIMQNYGVQLNLREKTLKSENA